MKTLVLALALALSGHAAAYQGGFYPPAENPVFSPSNDPLWQFLQNRQSAGLPQYPPAHAAPTHQAPPVQEARMEIDLNQDPLWLLVNEKQKMHAFAAATPVSAPPPLPRPHAAGAKLKAPKGFLVLSAVPPKF